MRGVDPELSKIRRAIGLVEEPRELTKGALAARPNSLLVHSIPALRDPQSDSFNIHFRGPKGHVKEPYLKPEILRLYNERTIFVDR